MVTPGQAYKSTLDGFTGALKMRLEEISKALAQGQRLCARYRDQHGFITSGVILGIEGNKIFIDTLKNVVYSDNIISIKHI